jgi:hypothetical protein
MSWLLMEEKRRRAKNKYFIVSHCKILYNTINNFENRMES